MANRPLTSEQKQALVAFRQRLGGVSEAKREQHKKLLAARKSIRQQLQTAPATVPELARAIGLPSHETLWHVTGMRKYGQVREDGEADGYVRYTLVDEGAAQPAAGH